MADSSDDGTVDHEDMLEKVPAETSARKIAKANPEKCFSVEQSVFLMKRVLARGNAGPTQMPWSEIQAELVAQFPGFNKTVEQITTRMHNIKQVCARISSGKEKPPADSTLRRYQKLLEDHRTGKTEFGDYIAVEQDGSSSSKESSAPTKRPSGGVHGKPLKPRDYRPFTVEQTEFITTTRSGLGKTQPGVWRMILAEYVKTFPEDERSERELQRRCLDVNAENKTREKEKENPQEAASSEESAGEEDFPTGDEGAETSEPSTSGGYSTTLELILDDDYTSPDENDGASNKSDEIPMVPPGVKLTAGDLKFLREMAKRSGASVQDFLDFMTPTTVKDAEADYLMYAKAAKNGGSLRGLGPEARYDRVDIIGSINRQDDSDEE